MATTEVTSPVIRRCCADQMLAADEAHKVLTKAQGELASATAKAAKVRNQVRAAQARISQARQALDRARQALEDAKAARAASGRSFADSAEELADFRRLIDDYRRAESSLNAALDELGRLGPAEAALADEASKREALEDARLANEQAASDLAACANTIDSQCKSGRTECCDEDNPGVGAITLVVNQPDAAGTTTTTTTTKPDGTTTTTTTEQPAEEPPPNIPETLTFDPGGAVDAGGGFDVSALLALQLANISDFGFAGEFQVTQNTSNVTGGSIPPPSDNANF